MGSNPVQLKKSVLASSIAAACFLSSTGANAQVEEEVVVTGIRASMVSSMDTKRNASGVVDAITAEDIGKFPDTNLAESLQRITGVSISRASGEGSQITVRGFGPDYNMVTLNGRTMPATSAAWDATANSRAFEFSNIASEGVSEIAVYKTGRADVASGGIGATIDLKTHRPLDQPGLKFTVAAKGLHDTTNREGSDITPEISGLYSQTFADDKFGVGVFGSYQERDSSVAGSFVNQWNTREWVEPGEEGAMNVNPDGITNAPAVGQLYSTPSDIRHTIADNERTRTNAQVVLQFAPTDTIEATLDYTWVQNELSQARSEQSLWFIQDAEEVTFDTNEPVATPVIYTEVISGNDGPSSKDFGLAQQQGNQVNTLDSVGLNLRFQATDALSFTFDLHDSSAKSDPDGPHGGSWINVGMGANVINQQTADFRGDLPAIMIDEIWDCQTGMNCNGQLDIDDVGSQVTQITYSEQSTDITQVRLMGALEFDNGRLDFGVESRDSENKTLYSQTYNVMGDWGIANPGDIPNDLLSPINFPSEFDDFNPGNSQSLAFGGSADAIGRWGAGEYGFDYAYNPVFQTNRRITEDMVGAFAKFTIDGELGGMTTNFVVGLRYESTNTEATTDLAEPEQIVWLSNNDFRVDRSAQLTPFTRSASYDHLLPSMDFSIDFTDDLKGRASYSKTIAQTTYNNLDSAVTVNQPSRPTTPGLVSATADAGNPSLVPLESDNYDLSLEWYFDDSSYASIGFYEKRVRNFIGTVPIEEPHFDLRDPTNGPRADAARAALEEGGYEVTETNLFTMVVAMENGLLDDGTEFGDLDPNQIETDYDVLPLAEDELYQFSTNTPVNNEEAIINGFELAVQHFFGDSGFGVQANYTTVDGDVEFNDLLIGEAQFALVGLSDTANLSLIYENYGFSGRIAYNWRDAFLDNTNQFNNNPSYTEEYSQIDLNVSYDINDNFQVFFEGINIAGEDSRRYGRSERQLWELEELGARYLLGGRYTF